MKWKARVLTTDPLCRWDRLYFYHELGGGQVKVISDYQDEEVVYEVLGEVEEPTGPGIALPYGCLDALALVLRPGPPEELLNEVRATLAHERQRVDTLLERNVYDGS